MNSAAVSPTTMPFPLLIGGSQRTDPLIAVSALNRRREPDQEAHIGAALPRHPPHNEIVSIDSARTTCASEAHSVIHSLDEGTAVEMIVWRAGERVLFASCRSRQRPSRESRSCCERRPRAVYAIGGFRNLIGGDVSSRR